MASCRGVCYTESNTFPKKECEQILESWRRFDDANKVLEILCICKKMMISQEPMVSFHSWYVAYPVRFRSRPFASIFHKKCKITRFPPTRLDETSSEYLLSRTFEATLPTPIWAENELLLVLRRTRGRGAGYSANRRVRWTPKWASPLHPWTCDRKPSAFPSRSS